MNLLCLNAPETADRMINVFAGGSFTLAITENSTHPTLRHQKSAIILILPNARPYRRDSILLFQRDDGRYVLHRLLRLPPDGRLLMNKDAQTSTEQIRPAQVLAADSDILRNKSQFFVMDGIFDYIPFHG